VTEVRKWTTSGSVSIIATGGYSWIWPLLWEKWFEVFDDSNRDDWRRPDLLWV